MLSARCPRCGGEIQVRVMGCPRCGTEASGVFAPDRFSRLSGEQLSFLETFLRCRGNLSKAGWRLGASYATIRGRLDDLLEALGYARHYEGGAGAARSRGDVAATPGDGKAPARGSTSHGPQGQGAGCGAPRVSVHGQWLASQQARHAAGSESHGPRR